MRLLYQSKSWLCLFVDGSPVRFNLQETTTSSVFSDSSPSIEAAALSTLTFWAASVKTFDWSSFLYLRSCLSSLSATLSKWLHRFWVSLRYSVDSVWERHLLDQLVRAELLYRLFVLVLAWVARALKRNSSLQSTSYPRALIRLAGLHPVEAI